MEKNEDILNTIKEKQQKFSKSQKIIADFIINHYDKAAYMTASRLGGTVGVSESTVVRFAIELGFPGYPEMQKELQSYIKSRLTAVQRLGIADEMVNRENILKSVLSMDINRIRSTMEMTKEDCFLKAVEKIISADRIYIYGAMSSNILARFLDNYFRLIFDNVIFIQPVNTGELYQQIFRMTEKDTLISISFPRYSKSASKVTKFAKERNANIIAITDSLESPLSSLADQLLLAKSDMASFADSLVAPLSLINALIVAVGMKRRVEIEEIFQRLEEIWLLNDVYEKE